MIKAYLKGEEVVLKGVEVNKSQDFISENEFVSFTQPNGEEKIFFLIEDVATEVPVEIELEETEYLYTAIELQKVGETAVYINDNIVFVRTNIVDEKEVIVGSYDHTFLKEDEDSVVCRKKESFKDFFRFMRPENEEQNIVFNPTIVPFLKEVLRTEDNLLYGVTGSEFILTLLDAFLIKGNLVSGAYGSLSLENIAVVDFYSEKELFSIPGVNIEKNIHLEEDDEEETLLESCLESMGEKEIVDFVIKAMDTKCLYKEL